MQRPFLRLFPACWDRHGQGRSWLGQEMDYEYRINF